MYKRRKIVNEKEIIEYAYGNLDIFIDNLIERFVEELKNNK